MRRRQGWQFYCNGCQEPLKGKFYKRRGNGKLLMFCTLECNLKLLEGNAPTPENLRAVQQAKDQIEELKWPEKDRARRRALRDALRSAAMEAAEPPARIPTETEPQPGA